MLILDYWKIINQYKSRPLISFNKEGIKRVNLIDFIKDDNVKSLFPLTSNALFIEYGENELKDYVYNNIFDRKNKLASFIPSPVVYSLKDRLHLRKSLQLDPIATFYFYDFVLRNSNSFIKPLETNRTSYGYGFIKRSPINSHKQYHKFRKHKYSLKEKYKYFAKVDIANCFNSFYHHDIVSFVSSFISQRESEHIGQFLREGNSGRTINCFPQGIYPAKVIGNFFLSFIENSRDLESSAIIRFLDDIYLFSNKYLLLEQDVMKIQSIIGKYALALNAEKTKFGSKADDFEERKLDKIKKSLLKKREEVKDYDTSEARESIELDPEEVEYLKSLINQRDVTEEDVELALALLKEDKEQAARLTELVLFEYPNLIKNLYKVINDIDDDGEIWRTLVIRIKNKNISEYELFWITRAVIDLYEFDEKSAEILYKIFNHPSATAIVKSAILEMTENDYGLFELKDTYLKDSPSGIQAACSVAGLAQLEKAKRNQIYKYAGKASPTMNVLCSICSKI